MLGSLAAEAYAGHIRLPAWCYRPLLAVPLIPISMLSNPLCWQPLTGTPSVGAALVAVVGLSGGAAEVMRATVGAAIGLCGPLALFILLNSLIRAELRGRRLDYPGVRWLGRVAVFSYSLYLTHAPVMFVGEALLGWLLDLNAFRVDLGFVALRYALYVPVCLAVGWTFYRLVEKPLYGLNQRPKAATARAPIPLPRPLARAA
jgi:peptidoglycan/LPS O-acetylase OafA/YrhL